eukprot:RCo023830
MTGPSHATGTSSFYPRLLGCGRFPGWLMRNRSGCARLVPPPGSPTFRKKCLFCYWDPLYPLAPGLQEIQNVHLQYHPRFRKLVGEARAALPRFLAVHLRLEADFCELFYGRSVQVLFEGSALDKCILSRCPQCRNLSVTRW